MRRPGGGLSLTVRAVAAGEVAFEAAADFTRLRYAFRVDDATIEHPGISAE